MAYRIKIDGNKIFRDTDYYYVTDIITGEERMVTKRWVLDNIVYIVNAAASKKLALHPTKDNFETAVDLLTRNLIKQIARKQGANMSTNQRLAEHPKYNVKTSVRSTDTMQELWDYIKTIQIPLAQIQIIFNYVYSRACNYYRDRGMQIEVRNINGDTWVGLSKSTTP